MNIKCILGFMGLVLLSGTAVSQEFPIDENSVNIAEILRSRIVIDKNNFNKVSNTEIRAGLRNVTGLEQRLSMEMQDSFTRTTNSDGSVSLEGKTITVHVSTDGKISTHIKDDTVTKNSALELEDQTDDKKLIQSARDISILLGANVEEVDDASIENIGVMERDSIGITTSSKRIARVVYINRKINGIAVLGERMSFVYDLMGKLERVSGRWSPTAYEKSIMHTTLSDSDIIESAVRYLQENEIGLDNNHPINLATVYKPVQSKTSNILEIQGLALVKKNGPDGSYKYGLYEFPLQN